MRQVKIKSVLGCKGSECLRLNRWPWKRGVDMGIPMEGTVMKGGMTAFAVLLFAFGLPCVVGAAQGDLDTTFNAPLGYVVYGGWNRDSYVGVVIQDESKIIVSTGVAGVTGSDVAVLRYDGKGRPDKTFGTGGVVTHDGGKGDDSGRLLAIQSDDKIVLTGYTYNGSDYDVLTIRYNNDGTLDPMFGQGGIVTFDNGNRNDYGRAVAIQADGKIIITARSSDASTSIALVLRYNSDGTMDSTFGTGGLATYEGGYGNDGFRDVAVQVDGKIIISGYTKTSKDFDVLTARYNGDGTLDDTFGTKGISTYDQGHGDDGARGVAIQADGKIVVSGGVYNGTDNDVLILRYDVTGTLDDTYGSGGVVIYDSGGDDLGRRLAIQGGGKAVVTGRVNTGADYDLLILRYNADGSPDGSFGKNGVVTRNIGQGNDYGEGVAIQVDNKIVVGGGSYNGADYDVLTLRVIGSPVPSGGGDSGCFIATAGQGS
jgi:uncharacterized delta-60 repeat protein